MLPSADRLCRKTATSGGWAVLFCSSFETSLAAMVLEIAVPDEFSPGSPGLRPKVG